MTIPAQLAFDGKNKEFQFRDAFVMPLLVRLGFGIVVNYHGSREFGRDVIFGDIDRFGHVVFYGMQIKYESSIPLSQSHDLIQDAEQATNNPFRHPQTGREEYISCFYIINAGDISDQARENFFNTIPRRGIRDARLLDGNALILLDKAASLNRRSQLLERLTGIIQEVRRNRNVATRTGPEMQEFVTDVSNKPFPFLRCRNTACSAYLNAPFPIHGLPVDSVDQYWEMVRIFNDLADSIGAQMVADMFRTGRLASLLRASGKNERLARNQLLGVWGSPPDIKGAPAMKTLVTDALWERLQPLLPPPPPRRFRFPGRKPLDYRKVLTGILFVLKTGIAWDDLPAELGWGCGKTCRDHLKLWHETGVWAELHAVLLAELNEAGQIDWSRALIDASFAKAPEGGEDTGPNPTDRSKSGSKHHVMTDAQGIPLAATVTAANVNEVTQALNVLTSMPPVGGKPGPKREKADRLQGDRGYDSEPLRQVLRWLGITPVLAKRNTEHGSGLGVYRWFVERTIAWLHSFGRLRRRLDRQTGLQEAFLKMACALICLRFVEA